VNCRTGINVVDETAGFTLLEVLLAFAILAIAYLAIMQNFSVSFQNISRLDRHGSQLFSSVLELEKHLLVVNIGEDVSGEIYVEGEKYMVVVVAGEEFGKLETLILKEL